MIGQKQLLVTLTPNLVRYPYREIMYDTAFVMYNNRNTGLERWCISGRHLARKI